jgi:hypothetical protein
MSLQESHPKLTMNVYLAMNTNHNMVNKPNEINKGHYHRSNQICWVHTQLQWITRQQSSVHKQSNQATQTHFKLELKTQGVTKDSIRGKILQL